MPSSQPVFKTSFVGALACCNHAIERNPQDESAWLVRGEHHEALPEFDRAVADCTRAIAFNPVALADFWRGVKPIVTE
jgi:hypothetical protein